MSNNLRKLKRCFETQKQQREAADFKASIARAEARQRFEREHPITAGVVPMVYYQEPKWSYSR